MEPKTGEKHEFLGGALVARSGELAISAAAAKAKAEVEAAYLVALHNKRDLDDARIAILAACKRPRFAESAIYSKPVGKGVIKGPSIRFAETVVQAMGNVRVSTNVTYEDDLTRSLHISVTDLEQNLSYGKDITLSKTVERRDKKGRDVVGERENSYGEKVYIVKATEDELQNKTAAAESKVIRNCGLRLVPQDIIEEAMDICSQVIRDGGEDPAAARKGLSDAFATLGIKPSDIKAKLGHTIDACSPAELEELRGMYQAIRDGETTWSVYTDAPRPTEASTISLNDLKPVENPVDPRDEKPKPAPKKNKEPPSPVTTCKAVWEKVNLAGDLSTNGLDEMDKLMKAKWGTTQPWLIGDEHALEFEVWLDEVLRPTLENGGYL